MATTKEVWALHPVVNGALESIREEASFMQDVASLVRHPLSFCRPSARASNGIPCALRLRNRVDSMLGPTMGDGLVP